MKLNEHERELFALGLNSGAYHVSNMSQLLKDIKSKFLDVKKTKENRKVIWFQKGEARFALYADDYSELSSEEIERAL